MTSVVRLLLPLAAVVLTAGMAVPETLAPIPLPPPRTTGGKPLMDALKLRSTSRSFAPDPLPPQTVSDLLWAASGVNRPDGRRTAPTARNWQEIDVVVVLPQGAYRYDAAGHGLQPVVPGDLRALTGDQDFARDPPLTLVFVADGAKMKGASAEQVQQYAWADSAFVSQNVYLYCASEGLATGVRASVNRAVLAQALHLADTQLITLVQGVGFPKR